MGSTLGSRIDVGPFEKVILQSQLPRSQSRRGHGVQVGMTLRGSCVLGLMNYFSEERSEAGRRLEESTKIQGTG